MVVAESIAAAKDAAERVTVDYEPLEAVTETPGATQSNVRLYDHTANVCIDADVGDVEATKAAFARAAHVAKFDTWVQRVTGVPLDARAAVGVYDPATNKHTLHAGSGGVVRQKHELATILGVPMADVRVECGDVGGNYGTRNAFYPEFALVVWAAKRLGRPVKWTCERSEAFASDYQGRDQVITLELALDDKGRFLALRGSVICNTGAHSVMYVPLVKCAELLTSVYRVPTAHIRARAALTNTPPTNPYRSAGRPEAIYAIERVIDIAAQNNSATTASICAAAISSRRRRSPTPTPLGMTYDCGDYGKIMDRALALSDWKGIQQAQARIQAQQQAARHRACQLSRNHQRLAARMVRRSMCSRKAVSSVTDRHAVERPGPRDELRAMRRRMARRRGGQHPAHPGRHRHRADRRRLAFGALDADGRRRHGQGVAGGDPEGARKSPATCWRPIRRTWRSPKAASR